MKWSNTRNKMKAPKRANLKKLSRSCSSVSVTILWIAIFIFIFNAISNFGECVTVETSSPGETMSSSFSSSSSSSSSTSTKSLSSTPSQFTKNYNVTNNEEKADLFKKAFKQILKLKSLPNVGHGKSRMSSPPSPPQYMLELYEKYRRGDAFKSNSIRGNTVRSILSIKGNVSFFLYLTQIQI